MLPRRVAILVAAGALKDAARRLWPEMQKAEESDPSATALASIEQLECAMEWAESQDVAG
jgi:hypothetical protein